MTGFFCAAGGLIAGKICFLTRAGAGAAGLFLSAGELVEVSVASVGKTGVCSIELVSGVVSTLGDGAASTVGAGFAVSVRDIVRLEVV